MAWHGMCDGMGNFFFFIFRGGGGGEVLPRRCRIMIPRPHVSNVEQQQKSCLAVVWSLGQFCPCVPKVWTASIPCSEPSPSKFWADLGRILLGLSHGSLHSFDILLLRTSLVTHRHAARRPCVSWALARLQYAYSSRCSVTMDSVPSEEAPPTACNCRNF